MGCESGVKGGWVGGRLVGFSNVTPFGWFEHGNQTQAHHLWESPVATNTIVGFRPGEHGSSVIQGRRWQAGLGKLCLNNQPLAPGRQVEAEG